MKNATGLLLLGILCSCANYKKPLTAVGTATVASAPVQFKFSENAKQAKFATIVFDLPVGYKYGEIAWGYKSCNNKQPLANTEGRIELEINRYRDVFNDIMKKRGYAVEDDSVLFKNSKERVADLQVAARITEVALNQCYPNPENKLQAVGSAALKVEWSVYSTLEKKVIVVIPTHGSTHAEVESMVGEPGILRPALADAVQQLASSQRYKDIVDPPAGTMQVAKGPKIKIKRTKGFSGDFKSNIETIKKSVATVTANRGTGSGFVISEDGAILTVEHVVSGSKYVKVNTASGKECYGEVVSSNKQRDLAVIRVDCAGIVPLPLGRDKIIEGSDVFAIGTPLSQELEFSVTKGVVSAIRKLNELDYIQSDVTVLPGNSGGPLLDSHGNVVGVTAGGITSAAVPVGVNFFIPLTDIDKYLGVELE